MVLNAIELWHLRAKNISLASKLRGMIEQRDIKGLGDDDYTNLLRRNLESYDAKSEHLTQLLAQAKFDIDERFSVEN